MHSGEAPREEYGDDIGIYLAEVDVVGRPPDLVPALLRRVRAVPRPLVRASPEAGAFWAPDLKWKWDVYFGGGHTTTKMVRLMKGKISKPPSEYFGTNIFIGASTMSAEEIRRRYVIGCDVDDVGDRLSAPRGHVARTPWSVLQRRLPRRARRRLPAARRPHGRGACYGIDVDALRAIADRIGPTPEDLGQDPTRRSDPAEIAGAQWWKAELAAAAGEPPR